MHCNVWVCAIPGFAHRCEDIVVHLSKAAIVDKRKCLHVQGHSRDAHSLDCKSRCLNLLYFCSVFFFYRCQKRLRRKIYCFHNSFYWEQPLLCCTHLHFEKCAIRISPTGKRTPHQPKCQLYLSSVELENNSNVIGCDGDDDDGVGQSKCSGCAPLVGTLLQGPAVHTVLKKCVKLHINLADLKRQNEDFFFIHQIQGYFWVNKER